MQNIHYECNVNDKKENGIQILKRYFEKSTKINENNQSEDKQNNNSKITANTNGGFQY